MRLLSIVNQIETLLARARQRDELAADRPEGCWCLGLGGTGASWVPGPNGAADATMVHTRYCECPDGQRMKSREDGARNVYQRSIDAGRLGRILRLSAVPKKYRDASFESFPVSKETQVDVAYLKRWVEEFTGTGRSVLLRGEYGVGKTGLAVATMRAVIDTHGVDAYFTTVKDLLDEIKATYDQKPTRRMEDGEEVPTTKALQDAVKKVTLLVLDDLGAERSSDWVRETLFGLINERHNQEKQTIFTSNLGLKALNEMHGERLVWRIVEMCGGRDDPEGIRHVQGPNLRMPNQELE